VSPPGAATEPRLRTARTSAWPAAASLAGCLLAGVTAALIAAGLSGALKPSLLVDTGVLVRWGLPVTSTITNLATALTVGTLVLCCLAFPAVGGRAFEPGLRLASAAAGVWALGSVLLAVLQYADVSGLRLDDPTFGAGLAEFLRDVPFGRYFAFSALIAALIALIAAGVTAMTDTGRLAILGLVGLVPPALAGHSAARASHETAVTSLGLHLLGVSVWVGGLLCLVLLFGALNSSDAGPGRPAAGPATSPTAGSPTAGSPAAGSPTVMGTAITRFSGLAGWCLALVVVSGVVNASLRIDGLGDLATPYGVIVQLKAAALTALGCVGWWQRRRVLPRLTQSDSRALFLRFAAGEVVLMSVAIGLAAALARTAPPAQGPAGEISAAEAITGYPMPAAPTVARWLTAWQPDLWWLTVAAVMLGLYVTGFVRLRRRGDAWPVYRVVLWLIGVALLVWITSGGPIAYGRVSFSGHMIGHMSLSMVVPIFLVLAAPVTLALRAVRPRHDGTRGPREWLLGVLESRFVKVVSHPITAALLFAFSLVIFYFSWLFEASLTTHLGHELMHGHFLLAGYLFVNALIGVDPGPSRPPYPFRLLLLLATMGFHAFFGVALLQGTAVLQEAFFASLQRPWHADLLADQRLGGGIAWGLGEIPTLALALILAVQWSREDDREARRQDRAADRDGDAELHEYNAMLARLAARSPGRERDARDSQ
jgi:cytochrome c oxidase assembly factor CtaG/putative copper export protein